jgi:SAM-dependent methyltransferase
VRREPFYNEPRYYDIAFGWDIQQELDFLTAALARHSRLDVRSVVDLACGTGRFAIGLARRGYQVSGIDLSRDMLSYAYEQARAARVPVELLLKDITDFNLFRRFDAAICMTGSIGYLQSAARLEMHLARVGEHLRRGGVYIIDAGLLGDEAAGEARLPPAQEWQQARDRVRVRARWEVLPAAAEEGAEAGVVLERFTLAGEERGWQRGWQQETLIRLYRPLELKAVVEASGQFELVACYQAPDPEAPPVPAEHMTGYRMLAALLKVGEDAPQRAAPAGDREKEQEGGPRGRRPGRRDGRRDDARGTTQRGGGRSGERGSGRSDARSGGAGRGDPGAAPAAASREASAKRRRRPRGAKATLPAAEPQSAVAVLEELGPAGLALGDAAPGVGTECVGAATAAAAGAPAGGVAEAFAPAAAGAPAVADDTAAGAKRKRRSRPRAKPEGAEATEAKPGGPEGDRPA